MHHVLICGAGHIGITIAALLANTQRYQVFLADRIQPDHAVLDNPNVNFIQLNVDDHAQLITIVRQHKIKAVISSLPYFCNSKIAELAAAENLHYFDLTEDVATTNQIKQIAEHKKQAFVPQCGLAPGIVSIIAHDLMRHFSEIHSVKIRVGALPRHSDNALHYSLTWSIDGLINEYGNYCEAITNGKQVLLQPLEGLEELEIDGAMYEAFNTSGGIGSLVETYIDKVRELNYKTIRYPGHCEKIKFLMNELKLNLNRTVLKHILENALPHTQQDIVIIYIAINGSKNNIFCEENYVAKFYPKKIQNTNWSAIQCTTAHSLCAIVDLVLENPHQYHGFIRQEQFSLSEFLQNQFGEYFNGHTEAT